MNHETNGITPTEDTPVSERKWTKGPWEVGNEDGSDERSIWAPGHSVIRGGCSEFNGVRYGVLNLSDARLIAAAPDLYEALADLLHDMIHAQANMLDAAKRDTKWEGCAEAIQPRVDKARAALQRAEGEG